MTCWEFWQRQHPHYEQPDPEPALPNSSSSSSSSQTMSSPSASAAAAPQDEAAAAAAGRGCMQHGCEHYRRRCKLVAPCCGEVFWCRHCHNQAKDDSEQDQARRHTLDRKQVSEVICALCEQRQPVAASCTSCGVCFGRYSCAACNFYDDDTSKQQFHCDACGICRVGGAGNFFHCATCNCCYSTSLRDSHVCVTNSMHQNCPVCCEYLFDSIRPISVLACGHTIHQACHQDLISHDTITCPLCLKCILASEQKAQVWRFMDDQVRDTPMPDEYKDLKVTVLCNDCSHTSLCGFHVVGHKCAGCGGYNTRRVGGNTQLPPAAAAQPPQPQAPQ